MVALIKKTASSFQDGPPRKWSVMQRTARPRSWLRGSRHRTMGTPPLVMASGRTQHMKRPPGLLLELLNEEDSKSLIVSNNSRNTWRCLGTLEHAHVGELRKKGISPRKPGWSTQPDKKSLISIRFHPDV